MAVAVAAASKRLPRPRATAAPTRPPQPGVCARGRRGRARCAGTTTLPALLARIKPARCGTLYYFACTYYFACSARVSRYVPSIFVQTCYARLSLTPSRPRRHMLGLTFGRRVVKLRCPLRARSYRPAGYTLRPPMYCLCCSIGVRPATLSPVSTRRLQRRMNRGRGRDLHTGAVCAASPSQTLLPPLLVVSTQSRPPTR